MRFVSLLEGGPRNGYKSVELVFFEGLSDEQIRFIQADNQDGSARWNGVRFRDSIQLPKRTLGFNHDFTCALAFGWNEQVYLTGLSNDAFGFEVAGRLQAQQ